MRELVCNDENTSRIAPLYACYDARPFRVVPIRACPALSFPSYRGLASAAIESSTIRSFVMLVTKCFNLIPSGPC
jgi:hypothetical protein